MRKFAVVVVALAALAVAAPAQAADTLYVKEARRVTERYIKSDWGPYHGIVGSSCKVRYSRVKLSCSAAWFDNADDYDSDSYTCMTVTITEGRTSYTIRHMSPYTC